MDPDEYFYNVVNRELLYEPEGTFYQPVWEFKYRFHSLQRYWFFSKEFVHEHISLLHRVQGDGSGEFWDMFGETAGVDIEYLPEYLRLSTLSFSLSLVENFLGSLCEELAHELGVTVRLERGRLPYINKHILWLTNTCNMEVQITDDIWNSMDTIRQIRNRFIHRINRDISDEIKETIHSMALSAKTETEEMDDAFVDAAFQTIASFIKQVETAYIVFHEVRSISDT